MGPTRGPTNLDGQRIDKWLWFARVAKSRTSGARLVKDGYVRVNGIRSTAPARQIAVGDVLTIALEREVRVLRVLGPGDRRGPARDARLLFEVLVPFSASAAGPEDAAGLPLPCRREAISKPDVTTPCDKDEADLGTRPERNSP